MLTGYLWFKGHHPGLPGFSCLLQRSTGIPCPTCYLTRATCGALAGQWETSLKLHAFGPIMAIALVAWALIALRDQRFFPKTLATRPLIIGLLALISYWLARLAATAWWPNLTWLQFP